MKIPLGIIDASIQKFTTQAAQTKFVLPWDIKVNGNTVCSHWSIHLHRDLSNTGLWLRFVSVIQEVHEHRSDPVKSFHDSHCSIRAKLVYCFLGSPLWREVFGYEEYCELAHECRLILFSYETILLHDRYQTLWAALGAWPNLICFIRTNGSNWNFECPFSNAALLSNVFPPRFSDLRSIRRS